MCKFRFFSSAHSKSAVIKHHMLGLLFKVGNSFYRHTMEQPDLAFLDSSDEELIILHDDNINFPSNVDIKDEPLDLDYEYDEEMLNEEPGSGEPMPGTSIMAQVTNAVSEGEDGIKALIRIRKERKEQDTVRANVESVLAEPDTGEGMFEQDMTDAEIEALLAEPPKNLYTEAEQDKGPGLADKTSVNPTPSVRKQIMAPTSQPNIKRSNIAKVSSSIKDRLGVAKFGSTSS